MRQNTAIVTVMISTLVISCEAVIVIGGNSTISETDPGNGLPWNQVAKVTNAAGTNASSGSAVYLGGGYLLTANHVSLGQGYVSFDGTNTYSIKAESGQQVASGVDLKIFQLNDNPGQASVNLLPSVNLGVEGSRLGYLSGWGVGEDPTDTFADSTWTWGASPATNDQRWGTNWVTGYTETLMYSHNSINYNYEALITKLGTGEEATEAGLTLYDSGGGLFIKDDTNAWFLMGISATVTTNGSSTFGPETGQNANYDENFFVRIAAYQPEITALMTDPLPVPEPAQWGLLSGLAVLASVSVRRFNRTSRPARLPRRERRP